MGAGAGAGIGMGVGAYRTKTINNNRYNEFKNKLQNGTAKIASVNSMKNHFVNNKANLKLLKDNPHYWAVAMKDKNTGKLAYGIYNSKTEDMVGDVSYADGYDESLNKEFKGKDMMVLN